MSKSLGKMLGAAFRAPKKRPVDTHRKARAVAKILAAKHGIEIERCDTGFNVWPPKDIIGVDPYEGDHYAQDWSEVLTMVEAYSK